jgi:6-hydroxy-3-succinoylpyridine 3-monooxygenase
LPPRTIVYVDGFNLYYGAVRGTPHEWLNLSRYFELLRPADDIQLIRYFTALVTGPTRPNQEIFLRALATLQNVDVILGKFMSKNVKCTLDVCTHVGSRLFVTHEEKRTDVNIAVHMLDDVYQNRCDRLILVSGDSDLVPGVQFVRRRFPTKEVVV